jgi:hypothetical protein
VGYLWVTKIGCRIPGKVIITLILNNVLNIIVWCFFFNVCVLIINCFRMLQIEVPHIPPKLYIHKMFLLTSLMKTVVSVFYFFILGFCILLRACKLVYERVRPIVAKTGSLIHHLVSVNFYNSFLHIFLSTQNKCLLQITKEEWYY